MLKKLVSKIKALIEILEKRKKDILHQRFKDGYNYAAGKLLRNNTVECVTELQHHISVARCFDEYDEFDKGIEAALNHWPRRVIPVVRYDEGDWYDEVNKIKKEAEKAKFEYSGKAEPLTKPMSPEEAKNIREKTLAATEELRKQLDNIDLSTLNNVASDGSYIGQTGVQAEYLGSFDAEETKNEHKD